MILLDTNVVSELMKDTSHPAVVRWYSLHGDETALPAVALAELSFGIARLSDGARRRGLEARLGEWRLSYAGRTIAFGSPAAMRYGPLLAGVRASGRTMTLADAQIAAMALAEDATVATRNVRDFEPAGVALVDPWEA